MLGGWVGNRRFGVALASYISGYPPTGSKLIGQGEEYPPTLSNGVCSG